MSKEFLLQNQTSDSPGQRIKDPLHAFAEWIRNQPYDQQIEIVEFVGYFCYRPLFTSLGSNEAKIFAIHEFLNSLGNNSRASGKLLEFVDEVLQFIKEINRDAESSLFNRGELIKELPGITSLYSMITNLSGRNRQWSYCFMRWQQFKLQEKENFGHSYITKKSSAIQPHHSIISKRDSKANSSSLFLLEPSLLKNIFLLTMDRNFPNELIEF